MSATRTCTGSNRCFPSSESLARVAWSAPGASSAGGFHSGNGRKSRAVTFGAARFDPEKP